MGKKDPSPAGLYRLMCAAAAAALLLALAGCLFTGLRGVPAAGALLALFAASLLALILLVRRFLRGTRKRLARRLAAEARNRETEAGIRRAKRAWEHEEQVRRLHHDIKNHLGVVCSMLEDGKTENARAYLSGLRARLREEDRNGVE